MQQPNMPQNYINYTYSIPYYNPCLPYFNYWNQPPLQGLYYANNGSFPYYQANQVYKVLPLIQSVNDTGSLQELSEQPEIIQKKKKQDLVKNIKQFSLKRIERNSSKFQIDQKENRNVYSNILRNFFRKLNDHSKIQKLVKSIIGKNGLSLTVEEFLNHVKKLKINHGKYLRFKKLRHLFIDEVMKEHSLVFRILFQYFTSGELLAQTLTSRKIGRWSVVLHLKGARQLKERLYH